MIFNKVGYFLKTCNWTLQVIRTYKHPAFKRSKMPKNINEYMIELQKTRKRLKAQSTKYSPSKIYLQIIGSGSRADARSVLLVTDHTNYLFNCGEGTQRLATEHHARLTKIEHIFLTRTVWENMGGILGMALTIQDTGVPLLNLHGPKGSIDLVNATKNFIVLNNTDIIAAKTSKPFTDQTMTINYVSIQNSKIDVDNELVNTIAVNDYQLNSNGKRSRSPSCSAEDLNNTLECKNRINSMMVYICKIHPTKGALDLKKCVAAGVPPGPLLGKLKSGEDITLPDGTLVQSKNVVSSAGPGPLFIILECPDEDWIDAVVENPVFMKHQYQTATDNDEIAKYIVHFTPETVLSNSKYQEWMNKFGKETQHLIVNENNTGISSISIHKMQNQLHLLHPTIFPILDNQLTSTDILKNENNTTENKVTELLKDNSSLQSEINEGENSKTSLPAINGLVHHCKAMNKFLLRPETGMTTNSFLTIDPYKYVEGIFENKEFLDNLAELQTKLNAKTNSLVDDQEYPRLLMLGTGSSVPNKCRNTSGMLLQIDKDNSIILDCGEGTVGQIIRFFGESEADKVLKSIKAIYISHLHADHHLGLIGIIKQRKRLTDEPLFLFAPQQIIVYLHLFHKRFESIQNLFKLIPNSDILVDQCMLTSVLKESIHNALNISNITTTYVKHCYHAFGVAITLADGRKISYSGDCEPCDTFLNLCKDSFLLIHEATMEDGLEQEAITKHHSTISQAINVGVKANANFILLTHFSQRYSKIPLLPKKEVCSDYSRIGIAYDFMMIKLSQLSLLPLLYPCLHIMFNKYIEILDSRATKRKLKNDLLCNKYVN